MLASLSLGRSVISRGPRPPFFPSHKRVKSASPYSWLRPSHCLHRDIFRAHANLARTDVRWVRSLPLYRINTDREHESRNRHQSSSWWRIWPLTVTLLKLELIRESWLNIYPNKLRLIRHEGLWCWRQWETRRRSIRCSRYQIWSRGSLNVRGMKSQITFHDLVKSMSSISHIILG